MRKVILSMHISLDGYVGKPDGALDWVTMSKEMDNALMPEMMENADTCLLGRVLYEGFSSYWPDAPKTNPNLSQSEIEFSDWIERAQKIVFSNTLEKVEWKNTRLAQEDIETEVLRLKSQPGKDIIVFGGVRFAQNIVQRNLIDIYDLVLNPVILGQGISLFTNIEESRALKLISSKSFGDAAVALKYASK